MPLHFIFADRGQEVAFSYFSPRLERERGPEP